MLIVYFSRKKYYIGQILKIDNYLLSISLVLCSFGQRLMKFVYSFIGENMLSNVHESCHHWKLCLIVVYIFQLKPEVECGLVT